MSARRTHLVIRLIASLSAATVFAQASPQVWEDLWG